MEGTIETLRIAPSPVITHDKKGSGNVKDFLLKNCQQYFTHNFYTQFLTIPSLSLVALFNIVLTMLKTSLQPPPPLELGVSNCNDVVLIEIS